MANEGKLDPKLGTTDELCHRWSIQAFDWQNRGVSSTWTAMQAAAGVLLVTGFPPEMDKDVLVLIDLMRELKESKDDPWVYSICYAHYCTGGSSDQKAKRIGIGRSAFYDLLGKALAYLKGILKDRGLQL